MIRISGEGEDDVKASYVFHAESLALETRIREIVNDEVAKMGLKISDADELAVDFRYMREKRLLQKDIWKVARGAAIVSIVGAIAAGVAKSINVLTKGL